MKTPTLMTTVLSFAAMAAFLGNAGAARQDAALGEIQAQRGALMAAVERGDAEAAAALFTADAQISVAMSEGPITGRERITGFWRAALGGGGVKQLELLPAEFIGQGDVRVETGTYRALDGERRALGQGEYLMAWVREGGVWRISRDFANAGANASANAMANTGGMPAASASTSARSPGLPADYASAFTALGHTLYDETNGLTTLYVNDIVATFAGDPAGRYPTGSVVLMEFAEPRRDGEQELLRDAHGQPLKGEIRRIDVMRRGDQEGLEGWQFASFRPDGSTLISPAEAQNCADCHRGAGEQRDFVFRRRDWTAR